jgi:hypothetical protein
MVKDSEKRNSIIELTLDLFCFVFWWYWALNSRLILEPHLQPFQLPFESSLCAKWCLEPVKPTYLGNRKEDRKSSQGKS